jgi:hypothetical protein
MMPTTCSYTRTQTRAEGSRVTLTIEARRARGASSIPENPPFRHRYSNPPPVPSAPKCQVVGTIQGCISKVIDEPSGDLPEPSDPGGGDDNGDPNPDPDPESGTLSEAENPIPSPDPNAEANSEEQVGRQMLAALERLAEHGLGGGAERHGSRAKLQEPDPFDGKDPKKLRGFLLQRMLNFCARPQEFWHDSTKVNYALSFLKEPALDYFEPYLVDHPADEPLWVSDYMAFTEELYLYFGPYDQVADAEVELEIWSWRIITRQRCFLLNSTDFHPCSSTTIRLFIAEPIWLCRSESRTKWCISINPEAWTTSEILSRRLTKGIGNDVLSSIDSQPRFREIRWILSCVGIKHTYNNFLGDCLIFLSVLFVQSSRLLILN